ncbi:MAG: prolyl oligopeptidase family serine peptidase [Pseudoxanthomonas sp.]
MIDRRRFLAALAALAAAPLAPLRALAARSRWPLPPQPARIPAEVGRYGHSRRDDYAWLRPDDWLAVLRDPASLDAGIKAEVEAENAYVEAMLAPARPLRDALAARLAELDAIGAATLEVRSGGFDYYTQSRPGGEHPRYLRRAIDGGGEQVLLDPDAEARGSGYYALHWDSPVRSADGRLIGWAEDRTGSGQFALRVREIASGRTVVADIDRAHGSFAFSPDGRYLYWVGRNDVGRAATVYRRDIGAGTDALIHEEADPAFFITLRTTASGRYLVVRLFNGALSEVRLLPLRTPEARPLLVEPRTPGLNYDVDDWNGRLVVLTDADGAADFKLMLADEDAPGRAHWRPWVAHAPGRLIVALHPFADALVREEWRDAKPRLVLMHAHGGEREIAFDEPAYALRVPPAQDWNARELAFGLQAPNRPEVACALDLATGETRRARAAAGFDPDRYEVRRLSARAADGEDVPLTVLMRRGAAQDGRAPLLLYGYGSYGASVEAKFEPSALALVERGWVYAIAHVRGGAEKGTHWWRSVLKQGKPTTFTDFIACAEHLVAQGYTAKRRMVARGMSAGGLLVGAVYAMRPDLWAGAIAQVPFVDVLNTMERFDEHPLGTSALPIWGDPRVPEEYASMQAWSPYERLQAADYPALLATGSVADERVAFYEPLKFAVKARALTTGRRPIMVRTEMAGGHAGASGASAGRALEALLLAFAVWAADDRWGGVPQRPGED